MLAHLRHAHVCRQSLIGRRISCDPTPGTGSTVDRDLHEATDGAIPFLLGQGPRIPEGNLHDFVDYDIHVLEALYLRLVELEPTDDLMTALQEEIQQHPICWTTCCQTLSQFLETLTEEDAEPLHVSFAQVVTCVQALLKVDNWAFLADVTQPDSVSKVRLDEWEQWFADLATGPTCTWADIPAIPRQPFRFKVVLHAYAGRRRRGDIERYMDSLSSQFHDHIIVTASVDIVIDSQFGDIAKAETRDYWLSHTSKVAT